MYPHEGHSTNPCYQRRLTRRASAFAPRRFPPSARAGATGPDDRLGAPAARGVSLSQGAIMTDNKRVPFDKLYTDEGARLDALLAKRGDPP